MREPFAEVIKAAGKPRAESEMREQMSLIHAAHTARGVRLTTEVWRRFKVSPPFLFPERRGVGLMSVQSLILEQIAKKAQAGAFEETRAEPFLITAAWNRLLCYVIAQVRERGSLLS